MRSIFAKSVAAVSTAIAALLLTTIAGIAADEFQGVWKITNERGSMEMTLSADGSATSTRGQGVPGSWKEEDGAAVISWNDGWTSKISKDGDSYKNAAWAKDAPVSGPPTMATDVEKVQ